MYMTSAREYEKIPVRKLGKKMLRKQGQTNYRLPLLS
jgi:hypothetical protein